MLGSILKIEQHLECGVCSLTLNQAFILSECSHRFCLNCIKESFDKDPHCPTCQKAVTLGNIVKDPQFDHLVSYVNKLKVALLSHTLTPLEYSLQRQELEMQEDTSLNPSSSIDIPDSMDTSEDITTDQLKKHKQDDDTEYEASRKKIKVTEDNSRQKYIDPSAFFDDFIPSFDTQSFISQNTQQEPSQVEKSTMQTTPAVNKETAEAADSTSDQKSSTEDVSKPDSELVETSHVEATETSSHESKAQEQHNKNNKNDQDESMKKASADLPMDTPIENMPIEDLAVEGALVERTPVENTPVESTPTESTPVESISMEKSAIPKHIDLQEDPTIFSSQDMAEKWECPQCKFANPKFLQTCSICHTYRNTTLGISEPPRRKKSKDDTPKEKPEYELTAAGENNTVNMTVPEVKTRARVDPMAQREAHILYTGLTPEDDKKLEKIKDEAAQSRLKIIIHYQMRDFDDITHIITSVNKKKLCKRTLKYLQGVLDRKWIVEPEWLIKSVQSKKWEPEEKYEVKGDQQSGVTHAPSKSRENQGAKLFEDMSFYFFGDFTGKHNKNDLLILCRAGGAKLLSRKPSSNGQPGSSLDRSEPVIIVNKEAKKKPAWLKEYQVRDPAWIIDCIGKLDVQ